MRILQTDSSQACEEVADGLRASGHEVLADCLPDPANQHGCLGLSDGECPLDEGVDLAITGISGDQQASSAGVVCSRRHSVPVAAIGRLDRGHADLGRSLERIARAGDAVVLSSVEHALHDVLERLGLPDGTVQLRRDATCERIIARIPHAMTDAERSRLAVRLLAAATATHRTSARRDVLVESAPPFPQVSDKEQRPQ